MEVATLTAAADEETVARVDTSLVIGRERVVPKQITNQTWVASRCLCSTEYFNLGYQ